MNDCQCEAIEMKFDRRYAEKKLETYRAKGPKRTTRHLLDAIKATDIRGMTLLDIGGGLGDIQHELMAAGLGHVHSVEASAAYLEVSKEEAERLGYVGKVDFVHGNFTDIADDIPSADIVTLDRVICCYHDMHNLVRLSSQKARKFYGLVYPRDDWWVKLGMLIYYDLRHWLMHSPMRYFVHSNAAIEALIASNGLVRSFYQQKGPWQIAVFARTD